ncbi:MAG TPA: hypothetical protein VNO70_05100 [Blastocatellia bacterium]|nr:hypothetical protein [Blastocatellia bacterium]
MERMRQAQELDPTSLILNSVEGWIYYMARDYDRAIAACRPAHFWLGQAYEKKGLCRHSSPGRRRASIGRM